MRQAESFHLLNITDVDWQVDDLMRRSHYALESAYVPKLKEIVEKAILSARPDGLQGTGTVFTLSQGGRSFELTFTPEVHKATGWISNSHGPTEQGATTLLGAAVAVMLQMMADRVSHEIEYEFSTSYQNLEEWMTKRGMQFLEVFAEDSDFHAPGLAHNKKFKISPHQKR